MTLPRNKNATAGNLAQSKKRHRVKPSGAVAKDADYLMPMSIQRISQTSTEIF
jgi:hypothetical protein